MAFQRVSMKQNTQSTTEQTTVPESTENNTSSEKFRMRVVSPQATQQGNMTKMTDKETTMNMNVFSRKMIVIGVIVVLVLGLGSGFAGAYLISSNSGVPVVSKENQKSVSEVEDAMRVGAVFGVPDENTFRDDTEGVLVKGGLEGEGSHTLLRPGGVSQNVYLTSSVVDLDQFENIRIRIWGETFKGQKAGWLMDVGRVEVKELNADKPEWYVESNKE